MTMDNLQSTIVRIINLHFCAGCVDCFIRSALFPFVPDISAADFDIHFHPGLKSCISQASLHHIQQIEKDIAHNS